MVISSLSTELPAAISKGLRHFALPSGVVAHLAHLPPLAVLFAALLGYNPLEMLLSKTASGKALLAHLPPSQALTLKNPRFFPQLIARPFMNSLHVVFLFSAAMTLISAGLSVFRGERFIYDDESADMPMPITHHPSPPHSLLALALLSVWLRKERARPEASMEQQQALLRSAHLLVWVLGSTPFNPTESKKDVLETPHG